ncbi:MAG: uracil-DNA glycosylase 2 [Myxococcaceae bacterium]
MAARAVVPVEPPVEAHVVESLRAEVPPAWRAVLREALAADSFARLAAFLVVEDAAGAVFPPRAERFAALACTPPEQVKVVLLGQDPYPTRGNANGLAFSVHRGVKAPASLKNLFLGLEADLGHSVPAHGDLTAWARQGVLLLNTVLTVREGAPHSHKKRGWEPFTEAVLQAVNGGPAPVVFLCLGVPAKAMVEPLVDCSRHAVLTAPHPSPLNGKAFEKAARAERLFTRLNGVLVEGGRGAVDFSL